MPIPFNSGEWLIDRHNPGRPGKFTGRTSKAGPHIMLELWYPDGTTNWRPSTVLERMPHGQETLETRLLARRFGHARDLRRVITYEKLKGTLHEVIYSMGATQIDFYPYQFKPVIKLINSPTERLILADEVGLGKTIESGLIWIELQARRGAKRLLVVCPKTLREKWRYELRQKFLLDAHIVEFDELREEINNVKQKGHSHAFALIATYSGLRPPKTELRLLDSHPQDGDKGAPKTQFLRQLRHSSWEHLPFDLVIFDEAHYMRNPTTATFHLGKALSAGADVVLCVSATPVHNRHTDLHSLIRLVDEDFLEGQGMFEQLLAANRPAVQAGNALARIPVNLDLLRRAVDQMSQSPFIGNTPLFQKFADLVRDLDPENKEKIAQCQSLAERLNLLGTYVNRTRRVQVKEHRPVRSPNVLEVTFTDNEMTLYRTILKLVRERCQRDHRPFHIFQVYQLQLRAASCLPALVREIRDGRFGDPAELLAEAFSEETYTDEYDDHPPVEIQVAELREILVEHDFEENDSKYAKLRLMLKEQTSNEKVIIFAYYRATLMYLQNRLTEDEMEVTLISGDVPDEERQIRLDDFKNPNGPRVLLTSEVGSEGIDLQFCRVLVNYDLPWNPIRVEQRIGRIDRVGQNAQKLAIVNFKVRGTIEERLYERLHEKLALFANTLGDLEPVIGREIQQLTVDLLSNQLTPEQEEARIEQSAMAIKNQLLHLQELEESGDALLALSDYLQRQIDQARGMGRFMQPEELEDYVRDFFEQEFHGTEINFNTPADGCLTIRLTGDAHASFKTFIQDDHSLIARPFHQREFSISFRKNAIERLNPQQRQNVFFSNHLSPLIRWITKWNQERSHFLFNVSALTLNTTNLEADIYCYYIERWKIKGLSSHEHLAYAVTPLNANRPIYGSEAEKIVQQLLRDGKDWDHADCDQDCLEESYRLLEKSMTDLFNRTVTDFEAENNTALQIRQQRIEGFFDRQIAQHEKRLQELRESDPHSRMLKATEGRLNAAKENKRTKLDELLQKARVDMERTPIAAGIFKVVA